MNNELIAVYEQKIAAMQDTINAQNLSIQKLRNFLSELCNEIGSSVADNTKKQAALSIKIQELKSNQTIEVSDKDATDLNITPDNEEDDFVVADDNEEDDFVVAD